MTKKSTHKITTLLLYLIYICIGAGCINEHIVVHQYAHTSHKEWHHNDTLFFKIPALSDSLNYQLTLGIRSMNTYSYQNLWLVVEQQDVLSKQRKRDTICIAMNDTNGIALGTGNNLLQYESPTKVQLIGNHTESDMLIYHVMKDNTLSGIQNVGIRITQK